jgi:hypothetical protein
MATEVCLQRPPLPQPQRPDRAGVCKAEVLRLQGEGRGGALLLYMTRVADTARPVVAARQIATCMACDSL